MTEKGVHSLLLRNFNQDPVENFFGAIRSLGYRNINPSTQGFSSAYKTLMLNNLTSSHSPGSNCEEDFTEGALASYRVLFSNVIEVDNDTHNLNQEHRVNDGIVKPNIVHKLPEISYLKSQTKNYIAGFIIKKLNTILFKNCQTCLNQICTNKNKTHELTMAREYNSQLNLKYPNITFCRLIQGIIDTFSLLPSICHRLDFKSLLISRLKEQYNLEIISCPIHIKYFPTKILNFTIKLVTNH